MIRIGLVALLGAVLGIAASATEIQGVLADWTCVKPMVKDGREKTLLRNQKCSLKTSYSREAYGLITVDKKFYKLDDAGRGWALRLLKDTQDKDNLKVVVTGDIEGDIIHVKNMSEL
jgi:hypothetical protein